MDVTPWNFEDYKSYLKTWIGSQPHKGHGSKAAMARAAQCQTAYISQVILGSAHLSLEQADKIASLLGLSEEETQCFLLLVQKDRAGTESLRRFFSKQIKAMKERRSQLKGRVGKGHELALEAQATYFSSWIYSAVNLLARMPAYEKEQAIAERLGLPLHVVQDALGFLQSNGLILREDGKFISGAARMHLPHDSPLVAKHHINWRLRSMQDLERANEESLHYSSAVTISKTDAEKIRELLMKSIESAKAIIKDSKDEELFSFCLDFFKV